MHLPLLLLQRHTEMCLRELKNTTLKHYIEMHIKMYNVLKSFQISLIIHKIIGQSCQP